MAHSTNDLSSKEQIIDIVRAKGYFFVSPKWRFDPLRARCNKLVKNKILKKVHWKNYGQFGDYFTLIDEERR